MPLRFYSRPDLLRCQHEPGRQAMSENPQSQQRRDSPAVRLMTLDILQNILRFSDNAGRLGEFLVRQVRELVGAQVVVLFQFSNEQDGPSHRIVSVQPETRETVARKRDVDLLARISQDLVQPEVWKRDGSPDEISDALSGLGYETAIAVPLTVGTVPLGTLLLLELFDVHQADKALDVLEILSGVAALVLRSALLYETQEHIIEARTRQLSVRSRIAESFLGPPSKDVYADLLSVVLSVLNSRAGTFGYLDETGDLIVSRMKTKTPAKDQVPEAPLTLPIQTWEDSAWGRALREYRTTCSNKHSTRKGPGGDITETRHISLPILFRGELLGFFRVADKESDYTHEDVDTLEKIADQVAPILSARLQQRKTHKELLKEKLLSEDYINSLPGLFYVFDRERFVRWNRQWYRVTGYSAQELAVRYGQDFFEGTDRGLIEEKMLTAFQTGSADTEAQLVTKDGRRIPYYFTGLRREFDGKPHLVGLGIDITDRKRAETEKAKLEAQLRQSQKMEALGTLAGGVAHEFNNILAGVVGFAELALMGLPVDSKVRADILQILKAGMRGKTLTQQILAYSRPGDSARKPVDVEDVLNELAENIRATVPANVQVSERRDLSAAIVMADPAQLHQALENLCRNGIQALGENGGTLQILCANETYSERDLLRNPLPDSDNYVRISIVDDGHGMSSDVLDRIFEPFFTTKGPGEGTGLGLAVVHGIVTNHGGTITVQSRPGKGSEFQVRIPLHEGKKAAVHDLNPKPLPEGSGSILFVDDQETICSFMGRTLEKMGFEAVLRQNPVEALDDFRKNPGRFDLVITDLTMPEMKGTDLCRRLREIRPDLRIIMATGYGDSLDREMVRELGIQEVLSKPYTVGDLSAVLKRVLKESFSRG